VSIEASSFVFGLSMGRGNGIRKLILLGFANHADKHGRGAYPSTQTIADYAECDVRTVRRHVSWLLKRGYLHEGDQRMVDNLDPRYRPIVYDVATRPEHINQWAIEAGRSVRNRIRAADAGRRGGRASSQLGRGDRLSPLPQNASAQASRGDNVSPLQTEASGDNDGGSEVTNHAPRGDSRVTRTIQEPPQKPSSSSPSPEPAPARRLTPTAGGPLTQWPRFSMCCPKLSGITRASCLVRLPAGYMCSPSTGGHEPRSATSSPVWRPPTSPAPPP